MGYDLLKNHSIDTLCGLPCHQATPIFPAVTCSFQASFRTAAFPSEHGMTSNGIFLRSLSKPMFWEQSARLVKGARIWETYRKRGGRVAMLFWQQSLGESVDQIISPAPIHKHHGGMIMDCYSQPADLYQTVCDRVGRPFALRHYWGPMASYKAGDWIAEATAALLNMADMCPDLCMTYLPTMDYDLQRYGPNSRKAGMALRAVIRQCRQLADAADKNGYKILFIGDYNIGETSQVVYPNQLLADAGFFRIRHIRGMHYPDFYASSAFAMVDHEIAHVYVKPEAIADVQSLFASHPQIDSVLDHDDQKTKHIAHVNSGELILTASPGSWFAYPWWRSSSHAPEYAHHIDIHNKPGYDPCELFLGWPPGRVSKNTARIRGSHGRTDRPIAWASNFIDANLTSVLTISEYLKNISSGEKSCLEKKG